jgi:hypothetical protein
MAVMGKWRSWACIPYVPSTATHLIVPSKWKTDQVIVGQGLWEAVSLYKSNHAHSGMEPTFVWPMGA